MKLFENYITKLSEAKPTTPDFYLKNWLPIPKENLTMITAPGGSGKSFLSIQIALKMLLENKDYKTLIWNTEDTKGDIRKRTNQILNYILNENDLDIKNIDIIDNSNLPIYFNDNNLQAFKDLFKPYNLIILDPLISFFQGEENSNTEARRFMNIINKIAIDNNQAIIIIHHHNKKDKEGNSRTRGASAFVDAARLLYEINNIENNKNKKEIKIVKDNKGVSFLTKKDHFILEVLPFFTVSEPTPKAESKVSLFSKKD